MLVVKISVIAVLAIITCQDFKSRLVSIFLFPLLVVLLLIEKEMENGQGEWFTAILMNFAFLILQLLILTFYFSLKEGRFVWVAADLLGWGDLLLLAACSFYFSFLNYIFFYLVSLFFSLISWVIYRDIFKPNAERVPLAGLQSLVLIVFLAYAWFYGRLPLTGDDWILQVMKWN